MSLYVVLDSFLPQEHVVIISQSYLLVNYGVILEIFWSIFFQ